MIKKREGEEMMRERGRKEGMESLEDSDDERETKKRKDEEVERGRGRGRGRGGVGWRAGGCHRGRHVVTTQFVTAR